MAHDIFISYAANDKPIADTMCYSLEAKGIRCWIAPRDILAGMDWGSSIIDAIASSRIMILLLSSHSNTSIQVKREVERAVNKSVIVIPFRIENVSLSKSLEYHLSLTHWMDALTPPMEKHLQILSDNIVRLLAIDVSIESEFTKITEATPVASTPPPQKRRALYIGIGAVFGLLILVAFFWWGKGRSKPESVAQETVLTSPASITDSLLTIDQKKVATNKIKGSDTSEDSKTDVRLRIPVIIETSYDVARELLIREGWQPNTRHISYGREPEVQGGNGPAFWKKGYWELVSSSGSGFAECLFEFIDVDGRVLVVATHGEETDDGQNHATVSRVFYKKE
ncbi:MAG: TIR domain-containing protein [Ginsengibacter sp.]